MNFFSDEELACPCCGELIFDARFRQDLNAARTYAQIPFNINSGYRCQKHNAEIGGSETSSHPKGCAADIEATNSRQRFRVIFGLLMAGLTRIGIRKTFIHVDDDREKDQEVCWL